MPLGAASAIIATMARKKNVVSPSASLTIVGRPSPFEDFYHYLMAARWPAVIAIIAGSFGIVNLIFALGYYLGGGIQNARSDSFADMFFFSVQTMATIGYGRLVPISVMANVLVSIEAFSGLLGLAMVTGIVFAKFSRPTARVRFSRYAVVTMRDGVKSLMFRMANLRSNQIVEAEIHFALSWRDRTPEGEAVRRFTDLELTRRRHPLFFLSWTAIHPIDERSPLYADTPETLAARGAQLVVSLTGLDETFSQTIHARHSYGASDIRFGARMVDIMAYRGDGSLVIDYGQFDEIEPAAAAPPRQTRAI
jgi:inward rectifier potassium channel